MAPSYKWIPASVWFTNSGILLGATVDFWGSSFLSRSPRYPCWLQEGSSTWPEDGSRACQDFPKARDWGRGIYPIIYKLYLGMLMFYIGWCRQESHSCRPLSGVLGQDQRGCSWGFWARYPLCSTTEEAQEVKVPCLVGLGVSLFFRLAGTVFPGFVMVF